MLTGILVPIGRRGAGRRARPDPPPRRAGPADRRRVRPAHPALVGPAAARLVRAAAARLPGPPSRDRARLARSPTCSTSDPFLDRPVRQLSLGQRMRGELAAALLHDPAVALPRRADDRPRRRGQGPRSATFLARSTASTAPPSCSRPTTWPTSSGSAAARDHRPRHGHLRRQRRRDEGPVRR